LENKSHPEKISQEKESQQNFIHQKSQTFVLSQYIQEFGSPIFFISVPLFIKISLNTKGQEFMR